VIDGDGLGAGVYDQIRHRGLSEDLYEFHGGVPAFDSAAYFNRRAEVWSKMADRRKEDAEIPDDPEMEVYLCGIQYGYSAKSQITLERKEDMKARGLAIPDLGHCLPMTFSVTLRPKEHDLDEELERERNRPWSWAPKHPSEAVFRAVAARV